MDKNENNAENMPMEMGFNPAIPAEKEGGIQFMANIMPRRHVSFSVMMDKSAISCFSRISLIRL